MDEPHETPTAPTAAAFRVPACRVPAMLVGGLLVLLSGCRGSGSDLVEAELRTRENQLREVREELFRIESQNESLQREITAIRKTVPPAPPEVTVQSSSLASITLGRGTGGLDEDGKPGDEALQVTVEPRDGDNSVIKAPGTLRVAAVQITRDGVKHPLCTWDVPPDALRKTWKTGFFSTGYSLTLPWKVPPSAEKVRVIVQLVLADGRLFEAEKDVTVKLLPGAADRKGVPEARPAPLPSLPPGDTPAGTPAVPPPVPGPPLEELTPPGASRGQKDRAVPVATLGRPVSAPAESTDEVWRPPPLCRAVRLLKPFPTEPSSIGRIPTVLPQE